MINYHPDYFPALGTITKGLVQGLDALEVKTSEDYPNDTVNKIGLNIKKIPGDWWEKTLKRVYNDNYKNKNYSNEEF